MAIFCTNKASSDQRFFHTILRTAPLKISSASRKLRFLVRLSNEFEPHYDPSFSFNPKKEIAIGRIKKGDFLNSLIPGMKKIPGIGNF